jgi:hypothetical protein
VIGRPKGEAAVYRILLALPLLLAVTSARVEGQPLIPEEGLDPGQLVRDGKLPRYEEPKAFPSLKADNLKPTRTSEMQAWDDMLVELNEHPVKSLLKLAGCIGLGLLFALPIAIIKVWITGEVDKDLFPRGVQKSSSPTAPKSSPPNATEDHTGRGHASLDVS